MLIADHRTTFSGIATPMEMKSRPVDHRGFPLPWFVTHKKGDGKWDFAELDPRRYQEAIDRNVCWVSGQPLGSYKAFCVGPMCVINRVAGDPPVKPHIGEWSAKVCPFMSRPLAQRAEKHADRSGQRGNMVVDNPGMTAVYVTKTYSVEDGLFHLGEPERVDWFHKGKPADRITAVRIFDERAEILKEHAEKDSIAAQLDFSKMLRAARRLLPGV